MAQEIPTRFEPAEIEPRITEAWLREKAFQALPDGRDERYVVMMPLPNVTGALHMGHAMDNVMQDLLTRWHRMRGANTLWQPGTDHAGIATQSVVEKRLYELEGKTRHDLGREKLVERILDWKDQFQARIVRQQQQMGCGCDWDRQRFTMDAVCSRAVRETFYRLFVDRLIYRGERLVNWDCHLHTAVADDEVETRDVDGHFWHLRYPVVEPEEGEPEHVVVATTRPETMLGDTAVACHPDPEAALDALLAKRREERAGAQGKDAEALEAEIERLEGRKAEVLPRLLRLRDMARAGRKVLLPLQEREIPLILDEWAKPELGSGCVKITPAHDPNDYEVWQRHKEEIGIVNLLNQDGTLNDAAGAYAGQDRFDAREQVVADLDDRGLLERVEDRVIPIGHSDRSKTPIEPYLTKQWFVAMGDVEGGVVMGRGTDKEHAAPGLAEAAIRAVRGEWTSPTGRKLGFHPDPERYANTYLSWLDEKRDWNISRQLWWGHRIPIWLADMDRAQAVELVGGLEGELADQTVAFLAVDPETGQRFSAEDLAGAGERVEVQVCIRREEEQPRLEPTLSRFGLEQDPDVLDTWFSSALWPFSTLGWPDPETAPVEEGQTPLGPTRDTADSCDYYYPGSCLVTGRDIITLWVARMAIMGLYNLGDLPFTDCFVHANILDGKGEKMSKSKGNGIDPADIIEGYGTDALRYVLCETQTGTQDIRIPVQAISPYTGNPVDLATAKHGRTIFTYICPESGKEFDVLGTMEDLPQAKVVSDRFEAGGKFCTKLWNASRLLLEKLDGPYAWEPIEAGDLAVEDRWILSRWAGTVEAVDAHLEAYNPSAAIGAIRSFFWSEYCDWYLEMIKPRLEGGDTARVALGVGLTVLDQLLRLLHPFIPFVTEELWRLLGERAPRRGLEEPLPESSLLVRARWPERRAGHRDPALEEQVALLQRVVSGIRDLRARYQVSPRQEVPATVKASGRDREALRALEGHLVSQARLASLTVEEAPARPRNSAIAVVGNVEVYVADLLDPEKERARLEKQRQKLEKQIAASEKKLANPRFVDNAPASVVDTERERAEDARTQLRVVEESLSALG